MSPLEQFIMYRDNHLEWCKWKAPRYVEILLEMDEDKRKWLWERLTPELKAEIRRLRSGE